MKRVVTSERVPIKMWLEELEDEAMAQVRNLANLPFAFSHIAVMPDCHTGYGMPIGSVLATREAVVPNAVGVDIGCGMCALRTGIEEITAGDLKKVMRIARDEIPVGHNWHKHARDETLMPPVKGDLPELRLNYEKATFQIGTLGGGNHFIEIQKGSDGYLWIMVHSGSRNLGYNVARHYNRLAEEMNEKYFSSANKKMGLAFFPLDTEAATAYLAEMEYCIDFAFASRRIMMDRMVDALEAVLGEFSTDEMINESHNFAAWEEHFNQRVLVHRKGATRAFRGDHGMIPGSQGTRSYIVRGLGNPESFMSCSHGAGRVMGRRQAQRELDLEREIAFLDSQGVIHAIRSKRDLDEAPSAYKNIYEVMENQKDLAEAMVELTPLAVIKG